MGIPRCVNQAAVKYRPDIDGLRALAILPVVWFHSGLPGLPGGFTGVDTFFVISGYLITLIIHREVADGSFRFARFYERRVRRIAPALLLVTSVATAAGFALLLPYELDQYARSAVAALAMVSNIFFWRSADYFELSDQITPLLHTWSLGVEEQFYLLFPAALILAERLRKTRQAIALLLIGSFVLCLVGTARSPAASFYLLPTRGWELMAGAALAVGAVSIPERAKPAAGVCGIALLIAAAVLLSDADPLPGWRALLPALGATLVIGSGPRTLVGRVLSARPLVFIGRISYSLYLWHWPIFVFMRQWRADPYLPPTLSLAGIALAFAVSAASYRWVETPARQRSTPYRTVLFASGCATAAILLAAAAAIVWRGLPQRLPPAVAALADRHFAYAPLAHTCTDVGFDAALQRCRIGPAGSPRLVLWGDSHAAAISEGVETGIGEPGVIMSMGACAPTLEWINPRLKGTDPAACSSFNERTLDLVERDSRISTVVLSAYWPSQERAGGRAMWQSVQRLVDRLNAHGKRVLIVAGVPDPGVDVPWSSAIRARLGRKPLHLTCAAAVVPLTGATIIDLSANFCRGQPVEDLFTDSNHISRSAGIAIVAPAIRRAWTRAAPPGAQPPNGQN